MEIGMAFGIVPLIFVLTSPLLYLLIKVIPKRAIICSGVFILGWSQLMIGGTEELFGKEP